MTLQVLAEQKKNIRHGLLSQIFPLDFIMLLNDDQIHAVTSALDGWRRDENQLSKTFGFRTFASAITWINRVAQLAEEVDHHPDIDIRYNEVTLYLTTHSHSGITEKDAYLAELIDELPGEHDE